MPYPTYHLGVSGFLGLLLRRWLDLPVLLLVNIPIDVEVLFADHWLEYHRHWHFHTLLVGGLLGAVFGLLVYQIAPIRILLQKIMQLLRVSYQPKRWKMVLSGVLGAWLHVAMDAIYHYDVQMFWPAKAKNLQHPLWGIITQKQEVYICTALGIVAIGLYLLAVRSFNKKQRKTTN